MKKLSIVISLLTPYFLLLTPNQIQAAEDCTTTTGSYGQTTTTCKVLGETTYIKHEVVNASIDPNLVWMIAGGLLVSAGLLKGLAIITRQTYWLD